MSQELNQKLNQQTEGKRRTFTQRITTPIMFFFVLHTFVVAGAGFFILWQFATMEGAVALTLSLLIGLASAGIFGLLLRREINNALSFSLNRILDIDRNSPKLHIREEDSDSNEEIAMIYANFSEILNNFNTLQMDIGAMADDHLKGVRSTVIDESKYKGATLEVVRRINSMTAMYKKES